MSAAPVVLVTGAGRGIGAATARLAAKRGYDVAVNYVANAEAAAGVVRDVEAQGRRAVAIKGDVAREADILAMFDAAEKRLGPIAALVNNAGIAGKTGRVEDVTADMVRAARERLKKYRHVEVTEGDMQALAQADASFDLVLLMHALTYSDQPAAVVAEAARVARRGGRVLAATLGRHAHRTTVEPFEHRNLGFTIDQLGSLARDAGLEVLACERLTRERRPPHFEVLSLLARKP